MLHRGKHLHGGGRVLGREGGGTQKSVDLHDTLHSTLAGNLCYYRQTRRSCFIEVRVLIQTYSSNALRDDHQWLGGRGNREKKIEALLQEENTLEGHWGKQKFWRPLSRKKNSDSPCPKKNSGTSLLRKKRKKKLGVPPGGKKISGSLLGKKNENASSKKKEILRGLLEKKFTEGVPGKKISFWKFPPASPPAPDH